MGRAGGAQKHTTQLSKGSNMPRGYLAVLRQQASTGYCNLLRTGVSCCTCCTTLWAAVSCRTAVLHYRLLYGMKKRPLYKYTLPGCLRSFAMEQQVRQDPFVKRFPQRVKKENNYFSPLPVMYRPKMLQERAAVRVSACWRASCNFLLLHA